MDTLHNPFKQALKSGRLQLGLWHSLSSHLVAEILADAGFDWILLDTEHAPNELPMVLAELQAMSGGTRACRRPAGLERSRDHQAPARHRRPVAADSLCRNGGGGAPRGHVDPLSAGGLSRFCRAGARVALWQDQGIPRARPTLEICLLLQVETKRGLENLEQIARVEGVDGVFIGPGDLSAALGYLGQPNHPEVVKIIDDMIRADQERRLRAGNLDRRRRTRPALYRAWLPVRRGRLRHRTAGAEAPISSRQNSGARIRAMTARRLGVRALCPEGCSSSKPSHPQDREEI